MIRSEVGRLLRLWLVFAFSYILLRLLYDVLVRGYIDVSLGPLSRELLYIPLIQTVVFSALTRVWKTRHAPS
jgi:hypothetical protein